MNTQNKNTFLFIGAHPDDETQVGGTMALLSKAGFDVHVYINTAGRGGKPNEAEITSSEDEIVAARKEEAEVFAAALGVKTYVHDNKSYILENNQDDLITLVRYIRKIRPSIVVLQNKGDYHYDHLASHNLGLQAMEIAMRSKWLELGPKIKDAVILETDGLNVITNPLLYVDITSTFDQKQNAVQSAYGERLGGLTQFDKGLSSMRGGRIGVLHAEAYNLLNPNWYRMTSQAAKALAEFLSIGTDGVRSNNTNS
jgi:LmbE family N-acetylglucosaminyl deacetylase